MSGRGRAHGARRGTGRLGPPRAGLFRDIVLAPDRESVPNARPVLSFADDDAPEFLDEIHKRSVEEYALVRRGVDHGRVAELEPEGLVGPRPRRRRRETMEYERWIAASPIFLGGAADGIRPKLAAHDPAALFERLGERGGLRALIDTSASKLAARFRIGDDAPLIDPERDLERVLIVPVDAREEGGGATDLWLKTGRLSTHPDDRSLRLRASFGREGHDDASADEPRHALVAELAQAVFPGARAFAELAELNEKLERFTGGPVFGTQHIAYWNAPGGGARFHHDAFAVADADAPGARTQRGVAYAQLTGRTLWLALSIEDMATRVREVVQWIESGDMSWLREQLGDRWPDVREVAAGRTPCLRELAKPDCGVLGGLVDAPEFTTCLADAGHALLLRPGDVLLLPNHGLERTAMHSVFSASDGPGYALSVAIRSRS